VVQSKKLLPSTMAVVVLGAHPRPILLWRMSDAAEGALGTLSASF
jgi:hypothetical protein